jgi:hypothetical protein
VNEQGDCFYESFIHCMKDSGSQVGSVADLRKTVAPLLKQRREELLNQGKTEEYVNVTLKEKKKHV